MSRAKPGEGRPFKRKQDGLWVVVVHDREGRRKYLYASSPEAIVEKRDEYVGGAAMGLTLASTKLTVAHQLDDWLEERRDKVRSSTWISYESHVRIHLASIGKIPLAKLRPADVRRLVDERRDAGCAPRTIAYSLTILRMALKLAIQDGLVPRNVATGVSGPRVTRAHLAILSIDESRHLVATAPDTTYGRLWILMLGTGMRLGECLGLRRGDVDVARRRVTIVGSLRPIDRRVRVAGAKRLQLQDPKTATSRRTIAVPAHVVKVLAAELAEVRPRNVDGLMFTTPMGSAIDARNVMRRWVAYRGQADLPAIRMHDLRHTCASNMLSRGATLFDVMKTFGHANISETANTYGHLVEGRSRELADDMDEMLVGGAG